MGNSVSEGSLQDHYELKDKLGVGTFGTVKRGIHKKTKKEVAVKIIKKKKITSKTKKLITREVEITMKLKHPGIVNTIECFESDKNVYLVLEICRGGEVFDRVAGQGKFSEKLASKVIKQIVEAVLYLHKQGIIHRDLKPENLLYVSHDADAAVKVTDFGFARRIDNATATMETTCGTLNYVAPEVLGGKPYGKECDNWSVGVITYVLLAGYLPFYGDDKHQTFKAIINGSYDFDDESWDEVSEEGIDLIKRLLTVDPKKRISLEEVLKHKWIREPEKCGGGKDFGDLFNKKLFKTNRAEKGDMVNILETPIDEQPDLYGNDGYEEETKTADDAPKEKAKAAPKEKAKSKDDASNTNAQKADAPKDDPPNPNAKDDGLKTVATGDV